MAIATRVRIHVFGGLQVFVGSNCSRSESVAAATYRLTVPSWRSYSKGESGGDSGPSKRGKTLGMFQPEERIPSSHIPRGNNSDMNTQAHLISHWQ